MRLFFFLTLLLPLMETSAQIIIDKSVPVRFLALGDSYTIGESVAEDERWPELLATALRAEGITIKSQELLPLQVGVPIS